MWGAAVTPVEETLLGEVLRVSMRRYTRLTNGFSKKLENHAAATAIHLRNYPKLASR